MSDYRKQRRAGWSAVTALATAGVLGLTGCGSSGGSAGGTGGPQPTTAITTPAAGGSAGGTTSAADVAAVKKAYSLFFSPDTPEDVSLSRLQNGPAFKATIDQQASGSMASGASAKVSKVTLLSADTAKVIWTIYVNSQPMLKDQTGYAVKEGGTWKVSAYTFCGLLKLQGNPPAACQDPSATEAPK